MTPLAALLQLVLVVMAAAALPVLRARIETGRWPGAWPWLVLRARLRKPAPLPPSASLVFDWAPQAALALAFAAALLVPAASVDPGLPFADLVTVVALLLASSLASLLPGLDPGLGSEGHDAARGLAQAPLALASLGALVLGLSAASGGTALSALVAWLSDASLAPRLAAVLAGIALAAAYPPREAGFASQGGAELASTQAAAALRHLAWLSLLAALLPPGPAAAAARPAALALASLAWLAKLAILELAVARLHRYAPASRRKLGLPALAICVIASLVLALPSGAPA